MSETVNFKAEGTAQDTGNTVLDSLVNIMRATSYRWNGDAMREMHSVLLELAELEPGGLKPEPTEIDESVLAFLRSPEFRRWSEKGSDATAEEPPSSVPR